MQVFSLFSFVKVQDTGILLNSYLNLRFWDIEIGECFFRQETSNSCVSASIQMVLKYFDFSPLPNQTQLAEEMYADINRTVEWQYAYIPFKNRGFFEYYNQSLSNDFNDALNNLKGNVSQNFPVIINTWYDENLKSQGKITHARVVTGYNLTGIFFHDPWDGPNRFLNYSVFSSLWRTNLGYWAFIVKREPKFDLVVEVRDYFSTPIRGVTLILKGKIDRIEITNLNGTAKFSNLTIANYVLSYDWRFQSQKCDITLTKTKNVSFSLFLSDQTISLTAITTIFIFALVIVWFLKKRTYFQTTPAIASSFFLVFFFNHALMNSSISRLLYRSGRWSHF
jgi:hypothetical protein